MAAKSWKNGVDGDWATGTLWTPAGAPAGVDDITINRTGTYTVTVDSADVAHSVFVNAAGATLAINGEGVLTPGTTLTVSAGSVQLNGGTISGGTLSATGTGTFIWDGGTLDGVTYDGTLDLSAPESLHIANGLTAKNAAGTGPGTVNVSGAKAYLFFDGTQIFDNATLNIGNYDTFGGYYLYANDTGAGATLTLGSNLTVNLVGVAEFLGSSIINQGTINQPANNSVFYISPTTFTNTGVINASGGVTSVLFFKGTTFTNQGTVDVSNGDTVYFQNTTFTNAVGGKIKVEANSTAVLTPLTPGGAWSNAGTITVGSAARLNLGGSFTMAGLGSITNSGGTISIEGTLDNTGQRLHGGGSLGQVMLLNGGTISGGTLSATGTGTFIWNGGTLDGVTYDGTLDLSASSASLHIANGLTAKNAAGTGPGTVNLTGIFGNLYFDGTQIFDNATLNIGNYGDYDYLHAATLILGSNLTVNLVGFGEFLGSSIINQGTINLTANSGTFFISPASFTIPGRSLPAALTRHSI